MTLATLSIRRPLTLAYAVREFAVFVDDMKVGGVKNGREVKFEIPPGRHSVYIKLDFYKSRPCIVELQPGESASLVCGIKGAVSAFTSRVTGGIAAYKSADGIKGVVSALTSPKDYLYLKPEEDLAQTPITRKPTLQPASQEQVAVHMASEEERVPAASEEVHVPTGVKIKVTRSRTVEHTVEVDWSAAGEVRLEAGLKQVVSGSIRGEISQKQGRSTTESETVEYEVELDGEKGRQYRLKWTDIWRKGTAEFGHGGTTHILPFRYRERSELEVMPVTEVS